MQPGEQVVVDGNFLIDAESNLKAALGALGGHARTAAQAMPASRHADPDYRARALGH